MTTTPTLETERLVLRPNRADDLTTWLAIWQQPAFYAFLGGKPISEEEAWTKMLRQSGHWPLMGYGYWAVEEKATGELVGAAGFADWRRDLTPSLKGFPEAGWVFAPRVHSQGYASEAMHALLAWGDAHLPHKRTVCIIDPDNTASLRLAVKLGYQEFARTLFHEKPIVVLERWAK